MAQLAFQDERQVALGRLEVAQLVAKWQQSVLEQRTWAIRQKR
jgi:hypothetical protein